MQKTTASDLATAIIENVRTYTGRTDKIRSVIEAFEEALKHLIALAERDGKLPPLHLRTGKEPVEMIKDVCTKASYAARFVDAIEQADGADAFAATVALIRETLDPVMRSFAAAKSAASKAVARELQSFLDVSVPQTA